MKETIKLALATSLVATSFTISAAEYILSWSDPLLAHQPASADKIVELTGINATLTRPLQLGRDLYELKEADSDTVELLMETGLFKHVQRQKMTQSPQPVLRKPIRAKGDVGSRGISSNAFNDPLLKEQTFLDSSQPNFLGLNGFLAARDYAEKNGKLNRPIRIAILDTGKWPHKDINWSQEEANFVTELTCSNPDNENLGRDVECRGEMVDGQYSNNAMDKSWVLGNSGNYEIAISGHGLAVASQIAAISNNNIGMVGIVPDNAVELIPVRVLNGTGTGWNTSISDGMLWAMGLYENHVAEGEVGYVKPISAPVDIINMSLGGITSQSCEEASYYADALKEAERLGIHVVIAAGNESMDASWALPAKCESAITVASNAVSGEISSFSNYGELVDISVLGENITTAYVDAAIYRQDADNGICPDSDHTACFAQLSGTSMATPNMVSGLALLMMAHPDTTHREREAMAMMSAHIVEEIHGSPTKAATLGYGAGVLDIEAAIKLQQDTMPSRMNIKSYYSGMESVAEQSYIKEVLQNAPNACETYQIEFGWLQHATNSIQYHVVQTTADEELSWENAGVSQTLSTPKALVDRSLYPKVGVQTCRYGLCSELIELDFSGINKPLACEG